MPQDISSGLVPSDRPEYPASLNRAGEKMDNIVLKMEGICKTFGEARVLKSVDFELAKGEVHALVGGNGAGKSTLMKIMTGVYTLDEGKIFVNGEQKKIAKPNDAKECGIAMIFQEMSLVNTQTVAENYRKCAFHASRKAKFELASLGNDAGIYGAARMVME